MNDRPVDNGRAMQRKALLELFAALYYQRTGAVIHIHPRDRMRLKELQDTYSDATLETYVRAYFEIDDEFFQRCGYSFGVFYGCIPQVQSWLKRGPVQETPRALKGIKAWLDRRTRELGDD